MKNGYVPANGVTYYYEIHGRGEPIPLLHGGLGSIEMFGPVLPTLA
jgi:pimeloyl-ACP methyl ester carboxylesterase